MAIYPTSFFYLLTPGGTNQYTVASEIPNASASVDAGDNTISVNEDVPVTFNDAGTDAAFGGTYTYLGREPGLPGIVTEGPDGNFYLISDQPIPIPNQNYNIQQIDFLVCFLSGTMIACPEGERAVETLAIGDLVLTADGRAVPVKWVGQQTVVTLFAPPEGRRPVCIAAGALGDNLPRRELRVTSDHALLIDGVLVHAGALINGTTIRRISLSELGERFATYHIETENHELVLAEGTPAETFIDNVTRRHFDNFDEYEALYGRSQVYMRELDMPRAMSARQVPQSIRAQIARRAAAIRSRLAAAG